jgi:hypothetical protein
MAALAMGSESASAEATFTASLGVWMVRVPVGYPGPAELLRYFVPERIQSEWL